MKTKTQIKTEEEFEIVLKSKQYKNFSDLQKETMNECHRLVIEALEEQAQELSSPEYPKSIHKLILDTALKEQKQKFEEVLEDIDYYDFIDNSYDSLMFDREKFLKTIKEALTDSNHNANLNVQVAEHQIGATESAQVGSSKLKDKAPETSKSNDVAMHKETLEDRGSNSNICENCGRIKEKHWTVDNWCFSKDDLGKKFTPKKEGEKK